MSNRNYSRNLLLSLTIIAFAFLFPACNKDWLDVKADKRQMVPASNKDLQAIMDYENVFNANIAECLLIQEVSADGHQFSDQFYEGIYPQYGFVKNAYLWSTILPFELMSDYSSNYSHPYVAILNSNTVLEAKLGDNEPNEFEHIKAQALYMRANFHFYLVQTFAAPFDAKTADQTLGVPLKVNADISETIGRSSVLQVYLQIIKDLENSIPYLPEIPKVITRVSKPAAHGLLARVYLSMGNYEKALHYANEYLKLKNTLVDFSTLDPEANYIGLNKEVTLMEFIFSGFGGLEILAQTSYAVKPELYGLYHSNDLRRTIYFNETPEGIRFKGNYTNNFDHRFVGIATDEIYLIRAECYARLDQIPLAMKDLNDLLRSRWAKNQDGSSKYADQTAENEMDALQKILLERRKELILRGLRWADLRRLNLDPRFAVTLKRTISGQEYTLEPNSPRYTFPFPKEAMERAPIEQNPGW